MHIGLNNIDDYDVFVIDHDDVKPIITKDKQIFIFFKKLNGSKCYHFTVAVHSNEGEICLFDPMARYDR